MLGYTIISFWRDSTMEQVLNPNQVIAYMLGKESDCHGNKQACMDKNLGKLVIALLKDQGYKVTAFYTKYSVYVYIHAGDK